MNDIKCPRCGLDRLLLKYSHSVLGGKEFFYKCTNDSCRCHFRARQLVDVEKLIVTDMSPSDRREVRGYRGQRDIFPGCPSCGVKGKVKTYPDRPGGFWRYHKCHNCGPYYTCENELEITVHHRLPASKPIDNV